MAQADFNVPVSGRVYKTTKAIAATVTTVGGVVALFITAMADGSIGSAEWGTIGTGILTAGATIAAVWGVENRPKV